MKMPNVPASPAESDIPEVWSPSKFMSKMSALDDCLNNPSWDEGTPKGERSLMTFVKSGSCTAILKVERPALKMVVSAPNLDEALASLELALRSPLVPWQKDDNPLGRGGKKKK